MKLKGISWFEQHVEKIVLGTVAAIFLGVVALQLMWQPNRVTVGKGDPLPPGEAFRPAEAKARDLQAVMNRTDIAGLPPAVSPTLAEDFVREHAGRVAAPVPVALGPASTITGGSEAPLASGAGGGTGGPLAALVVPAAAQPVVFASRVTVDPSEVAAHKELAAVLPTAQPFDAAVVSVEARFDGSALRAALMSDPDGGGPQRVIPLTWWSGNLEAMGVVLERQEQKADGSWGDAVEIAALPGRPSLVARARAAKNSGELAEAISASRALGEEVLRPAALRTVAGPAWKPPEEALKQGEGAVTPEIEKLLKRREDLVLRQERINRAMESERNRPGASTPPGGGGGRGGTGRGGGGGGGRGGGGGGGGASQPAQDPAQKRLQEQQQQLDRLAREQQQIEDEIRQKGGKVPGDPEAPATAPEAAKASKPLLDETAAQVWAHDVTAKPGSTYRYRLALAINNPLFGRGSVLPAEQAELGKQPLVIGKPSEWTSPVRVPGDRYMFLTAASPADALGQARASVEVYQFFYGYYRKGNATLEMGDTVAVGGLKLPEDRNKLPVWDMAKIAEGLPAMPGQPGAGAPGRAPGTAGRPPGRAPRPGMAPPSGGPPGGDDPRQPVPPATPATPALPDAAKPWLGNIDFAMDLVFLDVRASSVDGSPEAVFARGDGSLVVRSLEADRGELVQRTLQRSAREGENQGVAAPKPSTEAPRPPTTPPAGRDRDDRPPLPAGGGGGGSGGG